MTYWNLNINTKIDIKTIFTNVLSDIILFLIIWQNGEGYGKRGQGFIFISIICLSPGGFEGKNSTDCYIHFKILIGV